MRGLGPQRDAQGISGLHEREYELARIEAALVQARAGEGALVVVEGPSGTGSTRLLTAARALAPADGYGHHFPYRRGSSTSCGRACTRGRGCAPCPSRGRRRRAGSSPPRVRCSCRRGRSRSRCRRGCASGERPDALTWTIPGGCARSASSRLRSPAPAPAPTVACGRTPSLCEAIAAGRSIAVASHHPGRRGQRPRPVRVVGMQLTARWATAFVLDPAGVPAARRSDQGGWRDHWATRCRAATMRRASPSGCSYGRCSRPRSWR
jgi:hypothetical protein